MPSDTNKPSKRIASKQDSEAHAPQEEEDKKKKNAEVDSVSDDDDDDDEELFNLAQKWADSQVTKGQKGGDEAVVPTKSKNDKQQKMAKKKRKSIEANATETTQECILSSESNSINDKPRNQYSLHVTNLPYNATKEEIVQAFSNKGCRVISTRLVYNYHTSRRGYDKSKTKTTNSNGFTGVAFVDLADGKSYKLGLEMDKMIWGCSQSDVDENDQNFGRGWKRRRINVRPTKTKEELAQIVAQTKLKLAAQKQDRKEENNGGKQTLSVEKYTGHKQMRDSSSGKARRSPEKKRKLDKNDDPSSSKKKKKQKSEESKLTKKDRAKKAAILRSKKRTK